MKIEFILLIYVSILTIANLGLIAYIFFERYHAFKKHGERKAKEILEEHFQKVSLDEEAILQDFRNAIQGVIAQTELSGQKTLQELNENIIKSHQQYIGKFNEFSAKLYSVLVEAGNNFSQQMQQYAQDSNLRIEEWQSSYIQVVKNKLDILMDSESQKLQSFTEEEKNRIQQYIKEQASRETSVIVEEVLGNSISMKDQEKLAQQAVDKFFNEV